QNQQPSVVQWFIHLGATGYNAMGEKQELTSVASDYVDKGKVDLGVVKGYNAAVDKPLFDQFVKQQLPTLNSQKLDQWFTSAILAIPAVMMQACNALQPKYNSPPRVDPALGDHLGDVNYHGGHVIDGIANIYLVFWIDNSFQPVSPKYVSLTKQFVKDIVQTSLYANSLQYRDALGRCPTGARLAGTFIDRRPFPADIVAKRTDPKLVSSNKDLWAAMDDLAHHVGQQELTDVAAKQGWNAQDYHNFLILLPTLNWGCGWHGSLTINGQPGAPFAQVSYPYYNGKEQCGNGPPQSPNHDHIADIATGIISHELLEGVADPQPGSTGGWDEIADKCPLPSDTVDPQTNGNVTWNGHHYSIQEEYDNLRHGCVLEGP
ncbi:MAG TPA: hypothetical protein VHV10_09185, partial [Ktedonobacteraceae bacterium]|nr:hypothetical protein [Ktedonobacteraceae bacterium]